MKIGFLKTVNLETKTITGIVIENNEQVIVEYEEVDEQTLEEYYVALLTALEDEVAIFQVNPKTNELMRMSEGV